mgnify:CR=1 FL=1
MVRDEVVLWWRCLFFCLSLSKARHLTSRVQPIYSSSKYHSIAATSSGGRRPIVLEFQDDVSVILGVEMGAAHVSVALTNLRGKVLELGALPPMRRVCRHLGVDKYRIKKLFGGCRQLWQIAGLPNPDVAGLVTEELMPRIKAL